MCICVCLCVFVLCVCVWGACVMFYILNGLFSDQIALPPLRFLRSLVSTASLDSCLSRPLEPAAFNRRAAIAALM